MKLKTQTIEGVEYAVVQDGKPVYIGDDSREIAFDAPGTVATITRLNGEAKGHREAKEKAETALKAFEGITDPAAALKAVETLGSLDQKKLIDAGEVEKVKAEIAKTYQEKLDAAEASRIALETELRSEKIGGAFSRSKFLAEKAAIPADLVQARFGQNFKLEDGKVVGYDATGNKLYSKTRPGEIAEPDEALEMLFDAYPYRDQILKGDVKGGGGAQNPNGGAGGKRTMTRTEFAALPPADQMKASQEATIVD